MFKKWLMVLSSIVAFSACSMCGMDAEDPVRTIKMKLKNEFGFIEPSKELKREADDAIEKCGLSETVIFVATPRFGKNCEKIEKLLPGIARIPWLICDIITPQGKYHILVENNDRRLFAAKFCTYHELGHIKNGDKECLGEEYYRAIGAALGLFASAVSTFKVARNPKSTLLSRALFSVLSTSGLAIAGHKSGEKLFIKSNHRKEYAADSFACKKLIAEGNIASIAEGAIFLWNSPTPEKTHPAPFDRVKNILYELNSAGYNARKLPLDYFDKEDWDRFLLQKYYQENVERQRRYGGLMIGLNLMKAYVRKLVNNK